MISLYPENPGFKTGGTSAEAAHAAKADAALLRGQCEDVLAAGEYTADEVAGALGKSVLSIRPRFSELKKMGRIVATGERRTNISGNYANVWKLAA